MMIAMTSVLFAAAAAGSGAGGYTEIVPTRAQVAGVGKPGWRWPVFPSAAPVAAVATTAGAVISTELGGFWLSADGKTFTELHLTTSDHDAGASVWPAPPGSMAAVYAGKVVAIVSPASGVRWATCSLASATPNCSLGPAVPLPNSSTTIDSVTVSGGNKLWVAGSGGLFSTEYGSGSIGASPVVTVVEASVSSVVWNSAATDGMGITAGSGTKIWNVVTSTNEVDRWDWVTQVAEGWGGVVDDAVTDMAVGHDGTLYIANRVCLNTRSPANVYNRVGPDQGLPTGNVTAVTVATGGGTPADPQRQVWLGTAFGVEVWTPPAVGAAAGPGNWKYLAGPRWLAAGGVRSIAVLPQPAANGQPASDTSRSHAEASSSDQGAAGPDACGDTVVVVTDGGVTFLEQQCWTLAKKAARFEEILLARHDRHGLTSEASLPGWGELVNTIQHDNDNNGLWTSLVVVAEYMRYAVTGDDAALATGSTFFGGMVQLNEVTGKPGFMARSCCNATEAHSPDHSCGLGWMHDNEVWHNSTAKGYEGWTWKGDTSSDETDGHMFAFAVVAALSPSAPERAHAARLLNEIVGGIVRNGYFLIDITGKPTTWGRWAPSDVNGVRGFSDERGLQSLQIVAYIAAAANATAVGSPDEKSLWAAAYAELTNRTNQYNRNMLNLKITSPIDDNYSDDELTFLPFFTFLFSCQAAGKSACPFDRKPVIDALLQTFSVARPERSAMWGAMVLGLLGGTGAVHDEAAIVADVEWNLQTWPLEMICWPVDNTARKDIIYDHAIDRFGKVHTQSIKSRPPLPANERSQFRWNANPWDVSPGGDGNVEGDPGAWLLPYWMARYYKLIPATA